MSTSITPVVIEAAVSPFRADAPVDDTGGVLSETLACIAEGAGIVHYHHDARLGSAESIDTMIGLCRDVLAVHPGSILYPGILSGNKPSEHMAHLVPLADAGVLGLAPLDPGAAVPYDLDENGLPVGHGYVWSPFKTANRCAADMLARAVPITIGVYEPVQLRWALAYEAAGKLAPGSMLKLYFGGDRSLFNIGKPAINFGLPPTPQALDMYLSMMEGSTLAWNVGVMGGNLLALPLARYALERGGHLRVGIEDLAEAGGPSNADTVRRAVALAAEVGRPVATGRDASEVLTSGREA